MIHKKITILVFLLCSSYLLFSMDLIMDRRLCKACQAGDLKKVKRILEVSKNRKILVATYNSGGKRTPVHLAAKHGHEQIIEALKESGFSLNTLNESNMTPLSYALAHKKRKAILKLIRLGADIDLQDEKRNTLLHEAVMNAWPDIIEALVQKGAPLFAKNFLGKIPLELVDSNLYIEGILLHAMQKEIDRATIEKRAVC